MNMYFFSVCLISISYCTLQELYRVKRKQRKDWFFPCCKLLEGKDKVLVNCMILSYHCLATLKILSYRRINKTRTIIL